MSFHHIALATQDIQAVDHFYSTILGFKLVKVEIGPTPIGGTAKHFFYETGPDTYIAFWELHVDSLKEFDTAISAGLGLPDWVNHLSFKAKSVEDLHAKRELWTEAGFDVTEVDHNWCHSVYCMDPNNIMVEFCVTTGSFSDEDHLRAKEALTSQDLTFDPPPAHVAFHTPRK